MARIFQELLRFGRKSAAARSKRRRLAQFHKIYFADVPVDLEAMPQYRNELFPVSGPQPWIDRPDALALLDDKVAAKTIEPADAEICRGLIIDGYYIARNLIASDVLDAAWHSYERALEDGVVSVKPEIHGDGDRFPGRLLDPHLKIPGIRQLLWRPEIVRITDLLFGRESVPFQTIIGHKSSQQAPHSDAIHMTTYPLGFLLAAWIAFEDIHPDSGPLIYYPKSHRLLPYVLSADAGIKLMEYKSSTAVYNQRYEPLLQSHLAAADLRPEKFCGRKGDVLFWHANLVHGGSRRKDLTHSRKALVCHYFAKGAFTYHDLSGNASRLHRNGLYAEMADDRPAGDRDQPSLTFPVIPPDKPVETMRQTKMAKAAKKTAETVTHANQNLGRINRFPAVIYEGPTQLIYRIWARGAPDSILRVQADGLVRSVLPPNSIDVVGKRISVGVKSGDVSCEYQYLDRDA